VPFYFGINASPVLLSVGYIMVDNVHNITLARALQSAGAIKAGSLHHLAVTRYLGVGGMPVGGVWSLYKLRKSLLGGITAGLEAYRRVPARRRAGGADPGGPRLPREILAVLETRTPAGRTGLEFTFISAIDIEHRNRMSDRSDPPLPDEHPDPGCPRRSLSRR
jgi:hypothetical protein